MTLEEYLNHRLMELQGDIDHFRKEWLKAQKRNKEQFPDEMELADWEESWVNL